MTITNLACLHGKSIAVLLDLNGSQILVKGVGALFEDSSLGACLKIVVADPEGDFELILRHGEFNGEVFPGAEYRCDYRISLGSGCPSVTGAP